MTPASLKRRVAHWQAILGLQSWDLTVKITASLDGDPEKLASCEASRFYENAILTFSKAVLDSPEADVTIVHELVHVLFRDMEEAWMAPAEGMGQAAEDLFTDRITHEYEGVVDKLARIIVNAYK